MTRDETKQILMRIQSTYPNWKPQGDLGFVIDTWNEYFDGIQYSGYSGEEITEDADTAFGEEKAGDYRYSFALSMRLRGGNGCELN